MAMSIRPEATTPSKTAKTDPASSTRSRPLAHHRAGTAGTVLKNGGLAPQTFAPDLPNVIADDLDLRQALMLSLPKFLNASSTRTSLPD